MPIYTEQLRDGASELICFLCEEVVDDAGEHERRHVADAGLTQEQMQRLRAGEEITVFTGAQWLRVSLDLANRRAVVEMVPDEQVPDEQVPA